MFKSKENFDDRRLFATPFSPSYWKCASLELKSVKMLVTAALLIALRVAIKSLQIPVGESLFITFGFFVNAMGAMIFGPVMAIIGAAISDTIGALFFSNGQAYFFPFIFVEIAGSLVFALFLYRQKITPVRLILSRFAVNIVCNLILNPLILDYYYKFVLGKSYKLLSMPRVVKNLVLFPAEALLLVIFIGAMMPALRALKLVTRAQAAPLIGDAKHGEAIGAQPHGFVFRGIAIKWSHLILLAILFVVSAVAVVFYYFIYLKYLK